MEAVRRPEATRRVLFFDRDGVVRNEAVRRVVLDLIGVALDEALRRVILDRDGVLDEALRRVVDDLIGEVLDEALRRVVFDRDGVVLDEALRRVVLDLIGDVLDEALRRVDEAPLDLEALLRRLAEALFALTGLLRLLDDARFVLDTLVLRRLEEFFDLDGVRRVLFDFDGLLLRTEVLRALTLDFARRLPVARFGVARRVLLEDAFRFLTLDDDALFFALVAAWVSPRSARCLFTMREATSSSRPL